jgi:hypothetical protein
LPWLQGGVPTHRGGRARQVPCSRALRVAVAQAAGPGLGATRISAAGTRVRAATAADAPAFEQRFLSTLAGHPVRLPVIPPARRLQVSFNGTTFRGVGPATVPPGRLSVRLANHSQDPYGSYQLGIVWLASGHGIADVQAAIRRHPSAVPGWAAIVSVLPGPPGSDAAWAVTLLPGRYALVGVVERDGTLHALRQLLITAAACRRPGRRGRGPSGCFWPVAVS